MVRQENRVQGQLDLYETKVGIQLTYKRWRPESHLGGFWASPGDVQICKCPVYYTFEGSLPLVKITELLLELCATVVVCNSSPLAHTEWQYWEVWLCWSRQSVEGSVSL